jgi:hypothetical protein
MLKKALQPYKALLNDLEINKGKLVEQWQEERIRNLNPESLGRDEVLKKMEENLSAKATGIYKMMQEGEKLKSKLELGKDSLNEATVNQYQTRLEEIEKQVNDYAKESTKRKIALLTMEIEDLKIVNDTTRILYSKAQKPLNIDTAKSKNEIYNYYDEQKRINHYQYIKSKEKLAILDYISKKNWTEARKLEVLRLVYDADTAKSIDKSKDVYLTKIEQKMTELATFQNILKANEKEEERRIQLLTLLGEAEGKKVWNDVGKIIDEHQKQYTAH